MLPVSLDCPFLIALRYIYYLRTKNPLKLEIHHDYFSSYCYSHLSTEWYIFIFILLIGYFLKPEGNNPSGVDNFGY